MSFEEAQQTYLQESRELLEEMERSLLELEHSPEDQDLINAVFRAAHTIKGSGGIFGFDDVQAFTHVVENVLDRVRGGHLGITTGLTALLLQCRDHIGELVGRAVGGGELNAEERGSGERLRAALAEYQQKPTAGLPVERMGEVTSDGPTVKADTWHISVRFDQNVFKNGLDPLAALRYLARLGDLMSVNTLHERIPPAELMDPECCYLGLEIQLRTDADRQEIESAFEFFREDSKCYLVPPYSKIEEYIRLINSLPEEHLRLGEILVQGGALTQAELAVVLGRQDEQRRTGEGATRLGEILVEGGVVARPVVEAAVDKQERGRQMASKSLRIEAEKLDGLINLVGELVIAGASTNLLAQRTGDASLMESIAQMGRLVEEIRDGALRLRMVPIADTFNRFQRVVRDVSGELGKEIGLQISGGETELDKTVVEKIGDPLMHLVRNAMDHGIETAGERAAAGKTPRGELRLHAYHDSGSIVIEVGDDGRGLNTERILAKAQESGLVGANQTLSHAEIQRLIFEPGITTASQITNLSGRGVGMDVVRKNIEALRGSVDIASSQGVGTTITIRLPLTLAIIDGFLVGVGSSSYVVPLDTVIECIEMDGAHTPGGDATYINLRGEVLPFIRLHEMFGESRTKGRENIVVVQYGAQKAGLVVDELLGEFQTVIKPLGKIFQRLTGVSGATILGSGDVAVILDVPQLIQVAAERRPAGAPASATIH
jgi:two-component system chemotaxis sensor kinase CheA